MLPQAKHRKLYNGRKYSQDPLLNLHQFTPIRESCFPNTQEGSLKNSFFKQKGRYYSCEASASAAGLSVKKEELRVKQAGRVIRHCKHIRFRLKQKTDCFNQQYIQRSKLQKKWIDWVRFNIKYGIYIIWNRLHKDFQMVPSKVQKSLTLSCLTTKVERLGRRIQCLFGTQHLPNPRAPCADRLSKVNDATTILKPSPQKKQKQIIKGRLKPSFQGISNFGQPENIKVKLPVPNFYDTKHEQDKMTAFKDTLKQLTSAICLLASSLPSENMAHRQRNRNTKKDSLPQLLVQGRQRCEFINHLVQKLQIIQDHHTQLEQNKNLFAEAPLQMESLLEDLEANPDQNIVQKVSYAVQELSKHTLAKPSKKHCSMLSKKTNLKLDEELPKKGALLTREQESKHRASIELRIDGDGNVCVALSRSIRQSRLGVAKVNKGVHLKDKNKIILASQAQQKGNFKSALASRMQNSRKKKTIVFSQDVQELHESKIKANRMSKKNSTLKSKRQINNENSGFELLSNRSKKGHRQDLSFKSVRTITQNPSSSERMVKSLKTARQLKMMKGRLKKVRVVRNYREHLFRPETEIEQFHESVASDILNVTDANLKSTIDIASQKISSYDLADQDSHPLGSIHKTTLALRLAQRANQVRRHQKLPSKGQSKVLTTGKGNLRPAAKKRINIKFNDHMRQEKQLNQSRKDQIQRHLERLVQNGVIGRSQLNQYRQILSARLHSASLLNSQPTEEEEEQRKGPTLSPYAYLSALRKHISTNAQLSQINKYYYNFAQFHQEEEQISKTKQIQHKEEQFFKIRMQAEPRKEVQHFQPRLYLNKDSSSNQLQQKAI